MSQGAIAHYESVARALLGLGAAAVGLAMSGWLDQTWLSSPAWMAGGFTLCLAAAWQAWTLRRTRVLVEQQAQTLKGHLKMMADVADEQVQARDALRKAQRDNEAIMRALGHYVIVTEADGQGRLTRVNRRYCDISGYEPDELIGQNCSVVGSGWHTPAFWRSVWERLNRGEPWSGEICNRSKQGRLHWLQTLIVPFLGEDGRVERFVAIQSDVSEHRLAQTELRKSQALLSRTNRIAGVGGWYVIRETNGLQMTAECRDLLSLKDGETRTIDDLWQCFDAGARLLVRDQMADLIAGRRKEVDLVAPLRSGAAGPERWLRLVGEQDLEGRFGRVVGAVVDYTQQVVSQQRVLEEQRILHSAMDAVGEAFALYDARNRLVYFNDQYSTLVPDRGLLKPGASYEEVLRGIATRGDFKDAVGREEAWVQEVLKAPKSSAPGRIRQTVNGRWIRFIDRVTADGYRVVFRYDVTELQNALIQADVASVSKGQFLANMSHEIRTPINGILGLLELMGHTSLSQEQAGMHTKALNATRSLLHILNDILDYSKIEAGKMELHPVAFEVQPFCVELESVLAGLLGGKQIDVRHEISPDMPPIVMGDPVRLKQVLINLGGNAIKFTERGAVTLRCLLQSRQDGRALVRFEVEDTGIGIAQEKQAQVFDSFSQAEASTTRRFGGTGLGLSISQRLVHLMGGEIALRSEPGVGSTFAFEVNFEVASSADLPVADRVEWPADGRPRLEGIRILLAEDNALNQEVALAMLRREGAQVLLASNGQEAVDLLREQQGAIDIVLMDMQMPVLDGLQATEIIREKLQLTALPILAMTANVMRSDRDRCLAAGMNGHIGKPIDLDQVVAMVRHFTSSDQALTSLPVDLEIDTSPTPDRPLLEDGAALRRLGGDALLLEQLRLRFQRSSGVILQQIRVASARDDWARVSAGVHQLKGNAGVVGAEALANICMQVEASMRACEERGDDCDCRHLLRELAQIWEDTQVALNGRHGCDISLDDLIAETTAHRPADDDGLTSELMALKSLLEASDMEAIDLHESLLQRFPQTQGESYGALNACMEQMDLPAAADEVGKLLSAPSGHSD